jgi:MFS family permease
VPLSRRRLTAQPPPPLRVLTRRNFWPYFAGNLFSNCGTWFQVIAQSLLVYRLTGSTFLVGVVNFAQFVGVVVLAPWAGSAADRFDRRRLLVMTQIAAAAVTAALAGLNSVGLAPAPVVIALALVLGLTTAFAIPAMQALVPLLVPRAELGPAVALNSLTFNLARAIGPVVGALVVATMGITSAFALNSVSYLALIVGLAAVHPEGQAPTPDTRPKLRESFDLVRKDTMLAGLLLTVAAISLCADPVSTLTPGFATRVLHRPDSYTGYLVGAYGAGAVLAAVTVAGRVRHPVRWLPATCAMLGLGMVGFALAPGLAVAYGALAVSGFGFLLTNTTATTAVQLGVADSQRGRVMALWSLAFLGTRPFGSLADGAVAETAGLRPAALMMATIGLAAAVALLWWLPRTVGKMANTRAVATRVPPGGREPSAG